LEVHSFPTRRTSELNTMAVGAITEDSGAQGINGNDKDDAAVSAGAVYVFARTGTTWRQEAYVKPATNEAGDLFGFSVGLSSDGNTLAAACSPRQPCRCSTPSHTPAASTSSPCA